MVCGFCAWIATEDTEIAEGHPLFKRLCILNVQCEADNERGLHTFRSVSIQLNSVTSVFSVANIKWVVSGYGNE